MINKIIATYILIVSTLFVTTFNTATAEGPTIDVKEMTLEETVIHYSKLNGVDEEVMLAMMRCESRGQNIYGDSKKAFGPFQFWQESWNRMSKAYGKELDRTNPRHQAELAPWAVANGYGREWTSYRAIKNGGSYTFVYKITGKVITVHCKL